MKIPETLPLLSQSVLPYDDVDELLVQLAKYCIEHNLHSKGSDWYDFSNVDVKAMNKACMGVIPLNGGYFFLDDPNGNQGMIRLYLGDCNPKWSFWVENGEIKVDWA